MLDLELCLCKQSRLCREILAYGQRLFHYRKWVLTVVWAFKKWRYLITPPWFGCSKPKRDLHNHLLDPVSAGVHLYRWVQENITLLNALSRAPSDPASNGAQVASILSVKGEPRKHISLSDEDIWRANQNDAKIQKIYHAKIDDGNLTVTEATKFTILEDKAYRVLQLPHLQLQVCIPDCLWETPLQLLVDDPTFGHFGRYKAW